MGFVKRVCKICGHKTNSYSQCGREECDKNSNNDALPLREAIHDHCPYEDQHGLCTKVGCMAETVPLGLVNPPIDGSAPPAPWEAERVGLPALPGAVRGLDLSALAAACRDYLEVHDDGFVNDLSPYGPAVERLRDLLQPQVESRD